MTCREEIIRCANEIVSRKGRNEFTILEVVDCMHQKHTRYTESTIRTHISSKLCISAPQNHAKVYSDFERLDHGLYRWRSTTDHDQPSQIVRSETSPKSRTYRTPPQLVEKEKNHTPLENGKEYLTAMGFNHAGWWQLHGDKLARTSGQYEDVSHALYAFATGDQVLYIGKTVMSLHRRMYTYQNPGPSQHTNIRNHNELKRLLDETDRVEILVWVDSVSTSEDDLFLDKATGYESALIRKLSPPWNRQR